MLASSERNTDGSGERKLRVGDAKDPDAGRTRVRAVGVHLFVETPTAGTQKMLRVSYAARLRWMTGRGFLLVRNSTSISRGTGRLARPKVGHRAGQSPPYSHLSVTWCATCQPPVSLGFGQNPRCKSLCHNTL